MSALKKPTKYVELTLYTNSRHRISGKFHVPSETSTSVRPSDVISLMEKKVIRLTDATISKDDGGEPMERSCVDVIVDSVAWIEYPEGTWRL